jgi:hypothetical protein
MVRPSTCFGSCDFFKHWELDQVLSFYRTQTPKLHEGAVKELENQFESARQMDDIELRLEYASRDGPIPNSQQGASWSSGSMNPV